MQTYRDAGAGLLRPMVIRVGGDPVPGICEGLTQGVIGMTVGSRRRIVVPPEEVCSGGWHGQAVLRCASPRAPHTTERNHTRVMP